ncbi:MAG: sortase [Clostridia bacterium]|nr:sortase [Clostridia bacterium]
MKKHMRSLALLMAVLFALGGLAVAHAELVYGTAATVNTTTYIYLPDTTTSSSSGTTMKATTKQLGAGTQVNVYGVNNGWVKILVKDSSNSASYEAWIPESVLTAGASTTTTTTKTTTGTAGTITNCTTGVNMRKGPGTSYGQVTGVPKGATVSVLSSETGTDGKTWYKVSYGTTYSGYIRADFVATAGSASSSTGSSTTATYTKYETATTMVSLDKTIIMRKTAAASPSSANVVKKLTGVKGTSFSILGESGSWYFASYGSYQGFVRKVDFTTGSSSSASTATGNMTYATLTKTSADAWGYIKQIPGTNIGSDFGILYDNNIYCNALNAKGTDYYYNAYSGKKNYFFSLSPQNAETYVISGHNMRKSKTGFNNLHLVQNSLLSGGGSSTFYINFGGKTTWQVVGFFELNEDTLNSEASRKSAQQSILLNFALTGAEKQTWINQVMAYASSTYKGKTISSASSSDKLMVLYTCGDYGNGAGRSAGGYQNLYFLLKAVA